MEKTLAIIKPDAVRRHHIGNVISRIEREEFTILGMKMLHMSKAQAEAFYAIHKERPFFAELTTFMSSGPVVVLVLQKTAAVQAWRDVMGPTNPTDGATSTLRKMYGASIGENVVHGSDSVENGKTEVAFFFPELR